MRITRRRARKLATTPDRDFAAKAVKPGDEAPTRTKRKTLTLPDKPKPLPASLKRKAEPSPVRIVLNNGQHALVDAHDADRVARFNWYASRINTLTQYALSGNGVMAPTHRLMHRFILSTTTGDIVDHINGNGLDNRRCNLRVVTARQNAQNQFAQKCCTSRYKGVTRRNNRWIAAITVDGQRKALGAYAHEMMAAKVYDDAAIEYFGEFARTNEMMGLYPGQTPQRRNEFTAWGPARKTPIRMGPGDPDYDWKRLPGGAHYIPVERAHAAAKHKDKPTPRPSKAFPVGCRVQVTDGSMTGQKGTVRRHKPYHGVVEVRFASGVIPLPEAYLEVLTNLDLMNSLE